MLIHQTVANATLRIQCGSSTGSGFHFLRPDIVVTNHHVVADSERSARTPILGITEKGEVLPLDLLAFSPIDEHDYAVLQTACELPTDRTILLPKSFGKVERGIPFLFSGFPHGIPDLLVQSASIAGLLGDGVFYIDGSVNGGNSGGPIVDPSDGRVVGIVTQRRFLGAQGMAELSRNADRLRSHCQALAGRGSVQLMGIDFGSFAQMMAQAMLLINQVLEANANTGIGIGYSIEFVSARCAHLGISAA